VAPSGHCCILAPLQSRAAAVPRNLNPFQEKPPYNFNFSQASQFINLPTVDLGVNLQDWQNFARWKGLGGSLNVMWDVEKASAFTVPCALVDCTKVKMSGLAPDWRHKLDHAMAEVKAITFGTMPTWSTVNVTTQAWFLGDELVEGGVVSDGQLPLMSLYLTVFFSHSHICSVGCVAQSSAVWLTTHERPQPWANLSAVARYIKHQWGAPTKIYGASQQFST
jgi:hypothetical protein